MLKTRDAEDVLNHDFLETRGKILEVAAVLDRIDRAPIRGHETPDPRIDQIRQALEALLVPDPGRCETIQLIFSLEYDPDWRRGLDERRPGPTFGES
jgi:hypothetical protein